MIEPLSIITTTHTIVKPKVFTAVFIPISPMGEARSLPAQVGTPIVFPPVVPAVGKEHPHYGSTTTDSGKPVRAVMNDPTLER